METLEKYKLQISIFILVLALAVAGYFIFSDSKDPEFGPIDAHLPNVQTQVSANQIEKNLVTDRENPSRALVYKIQKNENTRQKATSIARALGFSGGPRSTNLLTWRGGGKQLSINNEVTQITYTNNNVRKTNGSKNETTLATDTENFLKKAGLLEEDLVINENPVYLAATSTHLVETDDFKSADFISYSFDQKLGDYFLYEENGISSSVTVVLNKQGRVARMVYKYIDTDASSSYPLRSFDEAIEDAGRLGSLVNTDPEGESRLEINQFDEIVIEDAFLSYVRVSGTDFIQPIFTLHGEGRIEDYYTDVVIQVPALEEAWLK